MASGPLQGHFLQRTYLCEGLHVLGEPHGGELLDDMVQHEIRPPSSQDFGAAQASRQLLEEARPGCWIVHTGDLCKSHGDRNCNLQNKLGMGTYCKLFWGRLLIADILFACLLFVSRLRRSTPDCSPGQGAAQGHAAGAASLPRIGGCATRSQLEPCVTVAPGRESAECLGSHLWPGRTFQQRATVFLSSIAASQRAP